MTKYHFRVEVSFDWRKTLAPALAQRLTSAGQAELTKEQQELAVWSLALSGTRDSSLRRGSTSYIAARKFGRGSPHEHTRYEFEEDVEHSLCPSRDEAGYGWDAWPMWRDGLLYFPEWRPIDAEDEVAPKKLSCFALWDALDFLASVVAGESILPAPLEVHPPALGYYLRSATFPAPPWSDGTQLVVREDLDPHRQVLPVFEFGQAGQRITIVVEPCIPRGAPENKWEGRSPISNAESHTKQ